MTEFLSPCCREPIFLIEGEPRCSGCGRRHVQCEGCDEMVHKSKAELESVPGAVLAWCEGCRSPTV